MMAPGVSEKEDSILTPAEKPKERPFKGKLKVGTRIKIDEDYYHVRKILSRGRVCLKRE